MGIAGPAFYAPTVLTDVTKDMQHTDIFTECRHQRLGLSHQRGHSNVGLLCGKRISVHGKPFAILHGCVWNSSKGIQAMYTLWCPIYSSWFQRSLLTPSIP